MKIPEEKITVEIIPRRKNTHENLGYLNKFQFGPICIPRPLLILYNTSCLSKIYM